MQGEICRTAAEKPAKPSRPRSRADRRRRGCHRSRSHLAKSALRGLGDHRLVLNDQGLKGVKGGIAAVALYRQQPGHLAQVQ
jgi:hypothetical protein